MKQKLILGTVQFGLSYGINNAIGKPNSTVIAEILDTAFAQGIKLLDTAEVYGDAIEQIGLYHQTHPNTFTILSKFKGSKPGELAGTAQAALNKLGVPFFEVYSYHSTADYQNHAYLKTELKALKSVGLVRKIGVSVYTNEELKQASEDSIIDVIQVPFNLLDNNNQRGDYISQAHQNGKEIHTRSAFLQGLFFMENTAIPERLNPLKPYLEQLKRICLDASVSMQSAALSYAVCHPHIDRVLIGVDNKEQLMNNIAYLNCNNAFSTLIDQEIHVTETALLNPSNWK